MQVNVTRSLALYINLTRGEHLFILNGSFYNELKSSKTILKIAEMFF